MTKKIVSTTGKGLPVRLIVPGDRRINLTTAAKALGVKKGAPVPVERAEEISGYPPSSTPYVGHSKSMRVIVDRSLLEHTTIFCEEGSKGQLLELKVEEFVKRNSALVADVSYNPGYGS